MITDARALEQTYVPKDLEHRDGQITQLATALRPITSGHAGDHSMIFGPAGSGKTTLAKFVVRKLQAEAFDVRRGYWNCMAGSSKTDVLYGLAHDAGIGAHLPRDGASTSRFIRAFREVEGHIVTIIDEVDVLEDETLLIGLGDLPNVTLVVITINEDDFLATYRLDGRVRSRFSTAQTVCLQTYTHTQLVDILQARVEVGLRPGAVPTAIIERVADSAAGDARKAIAHLENAVRRATAQGRTTLTHEDVAAVKHDTQAEIHHLRVDALGTHKRLLYDIVAAAGEIAVSDLHSAYEHRCGNPKAPRTRRRYLTLLEEKYGLLESTGTGRGTRYTAPKRE